MQTPHLQLHHKFLNYCQASTVTSLIRFSHSLFRSDFARTCGAWQTRTNPPYSWLHCKCLYPSPTGVSMPFSFPILKYNDIIACLREVEIPVTLDEIKNPTEQATTEIYERLVEVVMGVNHEMLCQPELAGLDKLTHRELHEQSVGKIGIYKAILRMMSVAGMTDFSITDITRPEPVRTKRALSAAINFAKYREQCLSSFEEKLTQSAALTDDVASLRATAMTLRQERDSLQRARQADMPVIAELETTIKTLTASIDALNRQQAGLHAQRQTLKDAIEQLRAQILQEEEEVEALQGQVHGLESKIVRSPQKLQHALSMAEGEVEREKACVAALKRQIDLVRDQTRTFTEVSLALAREVDVLVRGAKDAEKAAQLARANDDAELALADVMDTLKQLSLAEEGYIRELQTLEDRQYTQERALEKRKMEAEGSLEDLMKAKSSLHATMSQARERLRVLEQGYVKKDRELQSHVRVHEEQMNKVRDKCRALEAALEMYHVSLAQGMQ